jgi:hypothetical protein
MLNESWVDPCIWTDVTKLIVMLHNSANAPKHFLHADYTKLIIITTTLNLLYYWYKLNQAPYYPTTYIYSMLHFYFTLVVWETEKRFCIPRINLLDMTSKSCSATYIIVLCFMHYPYCRVCSQSISMSDITF